MHRFRYSALAVAVAALALLGNPLPSSGAQPAQQSGTLSGRLATDGGTFTVVVTTSPRPVLLNEPFELNVGVKTVRRVDDPNPLWLGVEATMPAHAHGMNTRAIVEPLADGRFVVRGMLFHMAGEWEIVLRVAKGRLHEQTRVRVLIE